MKLIPLTKKGRERIKQAGTDQVEVRMEAETTLFGGPGPWLFVSFVGAERRHDRWVHATADRDFNLEG